MKKITNKIHKSFETIKKNEKEIKKLTLSIEKERKKLIKNGNTLILHMLKKIIIKTGYGLTIEYDDFQSHVFVIKGNPLYIGYNNHMESSFTIKFYVKLVSGKLYLVALFDIWSLRYWEEKIYKSKILEFSLDKDHEKIYHKLYKEICKLVEVNNNRIHHKLYKASNTMAVYSLCGPDYKVH